MPIFSWSVSFLRPYRIRVSIIVLLAIAEIGLAALAPWPMKAIVDNVFGGQPFPSPLAGVVDALSGGRVEGLLITVALAGLALQLLLEVVRGAHTQVQVAVGQRIVYDLRARLLAHLQALPLRHRPRRAGEAAGSDARRSRLRDPLVDRRDQEFRAGAPRAGPLPGCG
jgi:subfamily B ATP-binding cassette protein MsbA